MVSSNKKKKSPAILFLWALFAILVVMFVANYRSALKQELEAPTNGVEKLYTAGGALIAVSKANEVWVWDWAGLADGPRTEPVKANNVLWLPGDRLILAPSDNSGTIIISDYMNDKRYKRLELNGSWRCEHLGISHTGKFAALLLADRASIDESSANYGRFRVEIFSPDFDKLIPVVTISRKNDVSALYEIDVSEDGAFIAAVGQASDFAWIGVFNVAQRKIVWEKVVETSGDFTDVAFSPNGQVIYAGGEGRYLYSFETASGKIASQLLIDEEQLMASFNEQRVTCTEVSPDGFMVAAGVNPGNKVYFWDTRTGKRLGVIGGCRGLNNLAFAPDSSTFVVAGRNYGGSLKVRRVPGK